MINRLIKNVVFNGITRSSLTYSDATKIRLNAPNDNSGVLQLKLDTNGEYPLDADIHCIVAMFTANAVQQWLGFECIVTEDPQTGLINPALTVRFRLLTTLGQLWWDGLAWSVAGPSDWNTEAEINDNLPAYSFAAAGNKSLGFVVNLQTTDKFQTPLVSELKVLGLFDIEFLEDLVYDSVIRKLHTQFRSTSVMAFSTEAPASTIDLAAALENKAYNVTAIRKVINRTDDSLKLVNLFASYAPGTANQDGFTSKPGVITLTGPVPASKIIEVTFEYVPRIMVNTNTDFYEVPAVPTMVFEEIEEVFHPHFTMTDTNDREGDFIRNKAALTAVQEYAPKQAVIRFSFVFYVDKQLDMMRLITDFNAFVGDKMRQVISWGLAEGYDLKMHNPITARNKGEAKITDTMCVGGDFDVLGFLFWNRASKDVALVGPGQFNVAVSNS